MIEREKTRSIDIANHLLTLSSSFSSLVLKYRLNLLNPLIVAPRRFDSQDTIEADLGRITIFNSYHPEVREKRKENTSKKSTKRKKRRKKERRKQRQRHRYTGPVLLLLSSDCLCLCRRRAETFSRRCSSPLVP
jgi:hypothetical protein